MVAITQATTTRSARGVRRTVRASATTNVAVSVAACHAVKPGTGDQNAESAARPSRRTIGLLVASAGAIRAGRASSTAPATAYSVSSSRSSRRLMVCAEMREAPSSRSSIVGSLQNSARTRNAKLRAATPRRPRTNWRGATTLARRMPRLAAG
jgi:hypothetical protein